MKKLSLLISTVLFSFNAFCCFVEPLRGRSFLSPRSQSVNVARDMVGIQRFLNKYDAPTFYGAFSIVPSYEHTYRPARIAEYFFGCDSIKITGSQVQNRQCNQILADYFGLSPTFESCVLLEPFIRNFLIDLQLYLYWGDWFLHVHSPYVWSKSGIELCENIINDGSETLFPEFYMDSNAIAAPFTSFCRAIKGCKGYGQVLPLQFGRIDCPQSERDFADLRVKFGYNVINRENGHVGFNVQFAAPTGTRPQSIFLFEPVVGNGHHWELGGGFSGHLIVWEKDGQQTIGVYVDFNATHIFSARQCRSFDLFVKGTCDCPNFASRYILAKEFDEDGNYTGLTQPLINVSTLSADVRNDVQFDIAIMLAYINRNWSIDFGYEAWVRSREKICLNCCLPGNRYALKGIQNVATAMGISNATQSCATIVGDEFSQQTEVADPVPPVFICPQDVDPSSAANPMSFTHKIFGNISYAWQEFENPGQFVPFLGAGAQVEFESNRPRDEVRANKNSISQWALWLKGGTSF